MSHIVLRGNTWHARLSVPSHLRHILHKREFTKSLKTSSKPIAQKRCLEVIATWKLEIASAGGDANATEILAAELKEKHREALEKGVHINPETGMSDIDYYVSELADELPESQQEAFYDVYLGRKGIKTLHWVDEWASVTYSNVRTHRMALGDVKALAIYAPTIDTITKTSIKKWLRVEIRSRSTVERALSFCRSYWRYLQDKGAVSDEIFPFDNIKLPDRLKNSGVKREPFSVQDLPILFETLKADTSVRDAALVSLYSGARVSEVMNLKVGDISETEGHLCMHIRGTKTLAADRVVPIHKALLGLVGSLDSSKPEEWVISGVNSAGGAERRGDVIGKRFGRLKSKCGFGGSKVFHSFRKTFITACEQAQVLEGVVADIVGHEKQTITYGLYSGGSSIEQRADAISRISFELE
jgi:integrase